MMHTLLVLDSIILPASLQGFNRFGAAVWRVPVPIEHEGSETKGMPGRPQLMPLLFIVLHLAGATCRLLCQRASINKCGPHNVIEGFMFDLSF